MDPWGAAPVGNGSPGERNSGRGRGSGGRVAEAVVVLASSLPRSRVAAPISVSPEIH